MSATTPINGSRTQTVLVVVDHPAVVALKTWLKAVGRRAPAKMNAMKIVIT